MNENEITVRTIEQLCYEILDIIRFHDLVNCVYENFAWDYYPDRKVIIYATTVTGKYNNSARAVKRDDLKQLVKEALHG